MKNTFKRTLAMALAVILLLSVSVIGVSAEETEVALNGGVNTETVTVYEFWQKKYASDSNFLVNFGATDMTNTLKDHYDNEELNWRIAWNTVTTDSCTGKSLFSAGRPYHYVQIGKSTGNSFYGLYLKSPGAGTYDVTLNYSVTNEIQAASVMKAYLFPATFVENSVAGGAQWKYVISGNDDNAENGTDTNGIIYLGSYSCYDANVAQYEERSLVKNGVELSSEQEYILVLAAVSTNGTGSTLKHYTNSLAMEKTSADAVTPIEKSVAFYTDAYGTNAEVGANAAAIKAAYEAENSTQDWRLETSTFLGQFASGKNNKFNTSIANPKLTMRVLHTASASSAQSFFAFRVKSPGTGNFKVSLTYGARSDGADDVGVYIIPASVIEDAVGEAGYTYSELATNIATNFAANASATETPFGPVNDAIKAVLSDAESAYSTAVVPNVSFDVASYENITTSYSGNNLVKEGNTISCSAGEEYIVVFKVEIDGKGTSNTYLYLTSLEFDQVVAESVSAKVGDTPYPTVKAALNAAAAGETVTLLADGAIADLKNPSCNIDLNGHDLTVYGDMTTVAAVSDSKDGEGTLKVTGKMNLAGDQAQLPLYDEAAGGYGFYSVVWGENNESEAVAEDATARKFWFQMFFSNEKAYELIASGTSGVTIGVNMAWNYEGEPGEASCVFVDKTEKTAAAFAAGWASFMETATNPWFYVTVRSAIEGMSVTPVVAANGVEISCAPIAY